MLVKLHDYLDKLIWSGALSRTGRLGAIAASLLRYGYAIVRDFLTGQLTLRAMSLVYTTLLSVIPLLAFSFALLKGFGVFDQLKARLTTFFIDQLGPHGEEITAEVLSLVDNVFATITNVRGSVLFAVSLGFLIWTAISMVQKVEASFNYVWYVSESRSIARRFTEYLIVLMISPIVMVTASSMIASISSNEFVEYLSSTSGVGAVIVLLGKLVPFVLVTAVFTFLYMFMPNTRVRFKSALVGGAFGALLFTIMGAIFSSFVIYSTRTQEIYAAFAIGITTLIWLYLNWMILLIGAQLAFYHQNPAFLRIGRQEPRLSNAMRERLALNIMMLVGQAFREPGGKVTSHEISGQLNVPLIALAPICEALELAGLLRVTDNEELVPGREMSRTRLGDILDIVRLEGETGSYRAPTWSPGVESLARQLDSAVSDVVAERTLSDLLDELAEPQPDNPN
ncbi:MAG: YihY family inner membrane protein [Gammaproteobacteria bacterium]|nr:YihY family inner membrane protein [Gammaproteobacteria bacterium]